MPQPIPLTETGHFLCKWPTTGEGRSMLCCGAPKTRGSYCAEHAALAFSKGTEQERSAGRALLSYIKERAAVTASMAFAGAVMLGLCGKADAQVVCMSVALAQKTAELRQERPVSIGQAGKDSAIIVTASPDGATFTLFAIGTNGMACILASGTDWEPGFLSAKGEGL